MTTYAISVAEDQNELRIEATDDNFGRFTSRAEAAQRIVEMVDGRIQTLLASKRRAKRVLQAEKAKAAKAAKSDA